MQYSPLSSGPVVVLILYYLLGSTWAEFLLHSFSGKIGAGNYTFYKLTREGRVRLALETLEGDTDLYVSDKTLMPGYDNYELQSVTCGEDEVDISADFKRPVGVAVYGHPSYEDSTYKLNVYGDNGVKTLQMPSGSHHHASRFGNGKEEDESILWTIFVGILKIIFDILV